MQYDFDRIIDRRNTNSVKYDFLERKGFSPDTIPLWVADMDFQVPDEVSERLKKVAAHGIFGYSEARDPYFEAVHDWLAAHHELETKPEWLVKTPGVVFAIASAIRAFSKEQEGVLIQRPVYHPFEQAIRSNNRRVVNNPLVYADGRYHIDFDDFEKKIQEENVKLFILCSPHNPVGRVWTGAELKRMGELCLQNHVLVVSDEIHCDFIYPGYHHTSFATISPELEQNSILCTSPSKTFNLAGLQVSNIFIPNPSLRTNFKSVISATGHGDINIFGLAACESAYRFGEEWLIQLKEYLSENLAFVRDYVKDSLPGIRLIEPEGTYLVWLDFSGLHLPEQQVNDIIKNKAKLWLDDGSLFGEEGKGFQRINIACPRKILEEAMRRLKREKQ